MKEILLKYFLLKYGIAEETVCAIMMIYENTRAMVSSSDGYTPYFEITTDISR